MKRGEALEGGTLPFRDMHRNFQRTSLPPISIRLVETQFGQKSKLKSHPFSIDLQNISEQTFSLQVGSKLTVRSFPKCNSQV